MPAFDDVVGVVTLVVCVAAVFLARRGARRKLGAQYAKGQADAQAAARSAASVVIGDVTYGRNGGLAAARHDYDISTDYDRRSDDVNEYDTLPEPMRRAGLSDGVRDLRDVGVGTASRELRSGVPVGVGPRAGRHARFVRASRSWGVSGMERNDDS